MCGVVRDYQRNFFRLQKNIFTGNAGVNTQKTVLKALVYLFEKSLKRELGDFGFKLATKQRQLPTVLVPAQVGQILYQLLRPTSVHY
jgi:hypothetical protein